MAVFPPLLLIVSEVVAHSLPFCLWLHRGILCWLCFAVWYSYKLTWGADDSIHLMIMTQTSMIICALMQRKYIHDTDKTGQHTFYVCNESLEHRSTGHNCTSGNILDGLGKAELLEHDSAPFPWQLAVKRCQMWMNKAICTERKPMLVIHKFLYLQSCVSTAFLCTFGFLNVWRCTMQSKASRSKMKSVVLRAINILVFIFPTARKIITYRWNNEFESQIIVFISDDIYYLH